LIRADPIKKMVQFICVVLAGVQNPWARRRRIELAELVNEPWALGTPESSLGGAVVEAFRTRGLEYPRATLVSDSSDVRLSLVASGRFLTIAPSSVSLLSHETAGRFI
jgi:DNA-binding transcriptional LysR family regulator